MKTIRFELNSDAALAVLCITVALIVIVNGYFASQERMTKLKQTVQTEQGE